MSNSAKISNLKITLKPVGLDNPNVIFYIFFGAFVADSVVNYFIHFPVFVIATALLLPVLWLLNWQNKSSYPFVIASAIFIITSIAHNLIFGFHRRNVSDLLFILLFIFIYHFYHFNRAKLTILPVYVFSIVVLLIFSFGFFGANSGAWRENKPLYESNQKGFEKLFAEKYAGKEDSIFKMQSIRRNRVNYNNIYDFGDILASPDPLFIFDKSAPALRPSAIYREAKPIDKIETTRMYHNGLFRLPHVASYFFGFLLLFFGLKARQKAKPLTLMLLLLFLFALVFTGARATLAAILLAAFLFLIVSRRFKLFLLITGSGALLLIFRNYLYLLFENTLLEQYFGAVVTLAENPGNFSRVLLWKSWLFEFTNFEWTDYLTGKSFLASMKANVRNLYFFEWYHSDPLSIAYVYGIPGLASYIWLIARIYRDNTRAIHSNLFVFSAFTEILITSFINGFYYFYPVFILFIFVHMSQNDRHHSKHVKPEG